MTDQERIAKLEKQVKTLNTINLVRFTFTFLTLIGVTAIIMDKFKTK